MSAGYEEPEKKNKQKKKSNRIVTFEGKEYIVTQLAREQQVPKHLVFRLLDKGMTAEEAIHAAKLHVWRRNIQKQMK
jgi:hypothetical protein